MRIRRSLAMLMLFILGSLAASAQTWTSHAFPAYAVDYHWPVHDPFTGKTVWPLNDWPTAPSIYVNSLYPLSAGGSWGASLLSSGSGRFTYSASGTTVTRSAGITFKSGWLAANPFGVTHIDLPEATTDYTINTVTNGNVLNVVVGSPVGTAGMVECPAMTSTALPDGHLNQNFALDTVRHRIYAWGALCSHAPIGADHKLNTWYLQLANPISSSVFNPVTTAHTPNATSQPNGVMWYDPVGDIFYHYGYDGGNGDHNWWVFAPTTSGSLSAAQIAWEGTSGVTLLADDWVDISGNIKNSTGATCASNPNSCPRNQGFLACQPGTVQIMDNPVNIYVPSIGKTFFAYSNDSATGNCVSTLNQQWLLDSATLKITSMSTVHHPPVSTKSVEDLYIGAFLNSNDGKVYIYDAASQHIWSINLAAGTPDWTDGGQLTGGPNIGSWVAYDPVANELQVEGCISCADSTGFTLWTVNLQSSISIATTVQEMLFPGDQTGHTDTIPSGGVARTNDVAVYGIPLAQGTVPCGVSGPSTCTGLSSLTLTEPAAGQFRCLGVWPDASCKWVEIATIASMSAGGTATVTLTSGGAGNFGGANLATDNGATITVATGAATFTLKKANHNGIDVATVGATTVTATGTSDGYALYGPNPATFPGNVTCLPAANGTDCSVATGTQYLSKNDGASTCAIEKNGPVQAVVKCAWTFKTTGGAASYMTGTARYYFGRNKTSVRVDTVLENATPGASNSYATAFKGYQGWELRTGANIGATGHYTMPCPVGVGTGCASSPFTGTLSGSDSLYAYIAWLHYMKVGQGCNGVAYCVDQTTDTGYQIVKTVSGTPSTLASLGTYGSAILNMNPFGYADIDNGSGVGVLIGQPNMAGLWTRSVEFRSGGTVAVCGLAASQNSSPYYATWPAWEPASCVMEFHATAPASLANDFLILQHPLTGRAGRTWYNTTGVFPGFSLVDPTDEDAFFSTIIKSGGTFGGVTYAAPSPSLSSLTTCCISDVGYPTTDGQPNIDTSYYFNWNVGGSSTQMEFRWMNFRKWLERGMTGRLAQSQLFWDREFSRAFPICGTALSTPSCAWHQFPSQLSVEGNPCAVSGCPTTSTNGYPANSKTNQPDQEHRTWWSLIDGYHQTGNEFYHDGLVQMKDWAVVNTCTTGGSCTIYQYAGANFNSRANGWTLMNYSKIYTFLTEIGDSDATTVRSNLINSFNHSMKPDLCVNGFPAGCDPTPSSTNLGGISRKRGTRWGASGEGRDSVQWAAPEPQTQVNATTSGSTLTTGYPNYPFGPDMVGTTLQISTDGGNTFNTYTISSLTGSFLNGRSTAIIVSSPLGTHTSGVQWAYPTFASQQQTQYCGDTTAGHREEGVFQNATASQGIIETYNALGTSWSDYQLARDLSYGVHQYAENELFMQSPQWNLGGSLYYVAIDGTASCAGPIGEDATYGNHLAGYFETKTTTGWSTNFIQHWRKMIGNNGGFRTIDDYGDYQSEQLITALAHPSSTPLQTVPITSFTDNGGGSYTIGWTTPAGVSTSDALRVKYSNLQIVDWIGFNNLSFSWVGSPTTTDNWFAATNATGIPAPIAGASQSMTIATGATGLTSANFMVKAFTSANCSIAPASLGPWTSGQSISQSFTASGCGTSTWSSTGVWPGFSFNTATASISGTVGGSPGTYTPTVSYDTATNNYSITVNAAPSITFCGGAANCPNVTQGAPYSVSLTVAAGTGTSTCALTSGSLTGSGLTLFSSCVISGTAATPGLYSFSVTPTDANNVSGSPKVLSVTVLSASPTGGSTSGGKAVSAGKVTQF